MTYTCGGPVFGKLTPGCPRCDALKAGAKPIQLALPGEEERRLCFKCFQKWERETFPRSYEEGMP